MMTTTLLFASLLASAQAPLPTTPPPEEAPAAAAPAGEAPELLLEPAQSPAPTLFVPAEIGAPTATTTTPAKPAEAKQPTAQKPADKPRLLVLDLVDQGGGPIVAGGLSQAMQGQAVQSYAGDLVTTAQLKVALDAAGLQALSGCMSEKCMLDLGSTVEAERTLGGSIARAGEDYLITLLLVDSRTGKRIEQLQRKVPSHEDLAYYAVKQLTSLLLTGRAADPLVPVAIYASEQGATVLVDGRHVGEAPVTLQLDPGRHEVRVEKSGFVAWKTIADVQEATPLELRAELVDPGFPLWPFAVSSGAVSAAALAGGLWFGAAAANAYDGSAPFGDPTQSYQGNPHPDTAFLLDKKQTVRERALWADILYGTAAVFGTVAVGLLAFELGAAAMAE